ncbi:MAG TPA: caspase family protein, partial [Chitinophagaceae bacterium]|nr:caspase family protein [Chitinophagaceae bacterium]
MRKLLITIFPFFIALLSTAQEKRALIIGIDKYLPPPNAKIEGTARSAFKNLQGCVNDGRAMHSVIVSKFQFDTKNIDTLFNEAANRNGILKAMNDLLKKSNAN